MLKTILKAMTKTAERRAKRQMYRELSHLDAHILDDIGVEIDRVMRNAYHNM